MCLEEPTKNMGIVHRTKTMVGCFTHLGDLAFCFLGEDERHRQMERMKLNQGFHTELRGPTQETEEHRRWNNLYSNGWIYSQLQLNTTREWFVGFTRLIQSHSQIGGATVTTNLQCSNFWWFGQCHKTPKNMGWVVIGAGLTLKRFWCVELEDPGRSSFDDI